MSLAFPDVRGVRLEADARDPIAVLAPRHYQDLATAAYEDAELLLSSILPDARIEHVGASAIAGAYSRGGVDICVAVPRDAFDESLGVLCEAGYVAGAHDEGADRRAALVAPHGDVALTLQLIESGSAHESLMRFSAMRCAPTRRCWRATTRSRSNRARRARPRTPTRSHASWPTSCRPERPGQPRCTRWMCGSRGPNAGHQLRHDGLGARRVVGAHVAHVDIGRHAAQLRPRVHGQVRLHQQHDAGHALRLAVVADEGMEQAADGAQARAPDRIQAQRAQRVPIVEGGIAVAALQVGDEMESVHRDARVAHGSCAPPW